MLGSSPGAYNCSKRASTVVSKLILSEPLPFKGRKNKGISRAASSSAKILRIQIGHRPNLLADSSHDTQMVELLISKRFCFCHFLFSPTFLIVMTPTLAKCAHLVYLTEEYGFAEYFRKKWFSHPLAVSVLV